MTTPADQPDLTRVRVNTEVEIYPALAIVEVGTPSLGEGFAIPRDLWRRLCDAQAELDAAETAIMRSIADRYPDASNVHEWLDDA